jgi:hypothetical protein
MIPPADLSSAGAGSTTTRSASGLRLKPII